MLGHDLSWEMGEQRGLGGTWPLLLRRLLLGHSQVARVITQFAGLLLIIRVSEHPHGGTTRLNCVKEF